MLKKKTISEKSCIFAAFNQLNARRYGSNID